MEKSNNTVTYHLEAGSFKWEIAPGKFIDAWGFNQQIPGPELKANAGDTMIVKVTNKLPEETIVHWHGIRLPASMDGTDLTQRPIQPGETFEYRFEVPDGGTFWYHSHANETVQMEKGLYGSMIIKASNDPVVDNDRTFMIDDMKLDDENNFKEHKWFLPRFVERHDGRQGGTLLLSGRENRELNIHAGQTERWRFINSSSARYFLLNLEGKEFRIISDDGGLIERPVTVTEALITPGERIDILVGHFNEGEEIALKSLAYNRVTFFKPKTEVFAKIKVVAPEISIANIPDSFHNIESLADINAPAQRKIKLAVLPSVKTGLKFTVNNKLHGTDEPVRVGELQIWEVENTSLMDHPFHLHGFFFQVLSINGNAPAYKAWKDTVNVPGRAKVKIAWMPDNRPGTWMYHCHIIEHHAAGMMSHFDVVNGTESLTAKARVHSHH